MTRRHPLAAAIAVALLLGAAACGSSSDGGSSDADDPGTTAAASSNDDGAAEEPSDPAGDDASPATGDASAVTLVDGPADPENTVTFTAEGAFEPGSIEISVDEVITFRAAEDAGTGAVTFDGSDTYTISGGLTESFTISAPGTYVVAEYLSGVEMTVTVTG